MVDEGIAARLAELDIVVTDLERSNLRIAEVERRNGELRSEIAALQSGKGTNAEERANKLEMNFRTLELEYDTVAQKLEQLQATAKTEKESVEKKVRGLEREVARRGEEVNELKGRLRGFDDYDEIKRELEILRVCLFLVGVMVDGSTLNFRLPKTMIQIGKIQSPSTPTEQQEVPSKPSSSPVTKNSPTISQSSESPPNCTQSLTSR
jgi:archaellum component FlaC